MPTTTAPSPGNEAGATAINRRIGELDALRGFALFGILAVNILVFGQPSLRYVLEPDVWQGTGDRAALFGVHFFFRGKFITLFSFLFGLGFAMMAQRLADKPVRFGRVYGRRVAMLLAFGLFHVLALWYGDILVTYALCGLLLPLFIGRSERTLKRWIVAGLVLPVVLAGAAVGMGQLADEPGARPAEVQELAEDVREFYEAQEAEARRDLTFLLRAYRSSAFADVFRARMVEASYLINDLVQLPYIFALFLMGVLAGRRRYAARIDELLPSWNRKLPLLLGAGTVLTVVWYQVERTADPFAADLSLVLWPALYVVATPLMALAYVLLFLNLYRRLRDSVVARGLDAMGKLALTNYLLQSVIATTLFYGYGLGLYGSIGPAGLLGIGVAIVVVQMAASLVYLHHFRRGPAEWLWRLVTYWKRP